MDYYRALWNETRSLYTSEFDQQEQAKLWDELSAEFGEPEVRLTEAEGRISDACDMFGYPQPEPYDGREIWGDNFDRIPKWHEAEDPNYWERLEASAEAVEKLSEKQEANRQAIEKYREARLAAYRELSGLGRRDVAYPFGTRTLFANHSATAHTRESDRPV